MRGFRLGIVISFAILLFAMMAAPVLGAEKISIIGPKNFGAEFDQAIENFEASTGITVEVITRGKWADMLDKVITLSMGGVPPDVVYGPDLYMSDLTSQGFLEPLDSLIARDKVDLGHYPAPVINFSRKNGRIFSMPTAVSIYANYYNVDIFDQMGVKRLSRDWTGNDLGWDEFKGLAKKLTVDKDGDGTPEQYALDNFGSGLGFNMLGIWGLQDVTPDRSQYLGTDPKVIDALEKMLTLWTELNAVGGVRGRFEESKSAIMPNQANMLNSMVKFEQQGGFFNWSLGVLPKGTTRSSQASIHSMGVVAASKHKEAAWKLVKYLSYNPEGTVLFTRGENRVPVLPQATQDFINRWSRNHPEAHAEVMAGAINYMWPWTVTLGNGGWDIVVMQRDAFAKIQAGQQSVRGAMEEIAPAVQAILDEGK